MKYCYLILFFFIFSTSYAAKPIICNQEYALCTSAPCVPDPRHSDYAICSCVVEKGDSAGYSSCEKRTPKKQKLKTTQLVSTFSFEQFNTKKSLSCTKGNPWTDCVDALCTIDPMDATKAICSCKVNHDQAFFTFGGSCDSKTCETGFWSGATTTAGTELRNAMFKKLKITKNPWPNAACSANP